MTEYDPQVARVWQDVQTILPVDNFIAVDEKRSSTNNVLLAQGFSGDTEYVIKMPRNDTDGWDQISAEAEACNLLESHVVSTPLAIPRSVHLSMQPLYAVFSFVKGVPLVDRLALSVEEQRTVGKATGHFMACLGKAIPPEALDSRVHKPQNHPFELAAHDVLLPDRLQMTQALGCRAMENLLHDLHDFRLRNGEQLQEASLIGHGDLHSGNVIVSTGSTIRPKGVIDFGMLCRSTPEYELRNMIECGPYALDGAINEYQRFAGHAVCRDFVEYWSLRRWMAACFFLKARGKSTPEDVVHNLEYLRPGEDWSQEIQKWNSGPPEEYESMRR